MIHPIITNVSWGSEKVYRETQLEYNYHKPIKTFSAPVNYFSETNQYLQLDAEASQETGIKH